MQPPGAGCSAGSPALTEPLSRFKLRQVQVFVGRTIVLAVEASRLMSEGGWKVGMYVDDGATDEQFAALGAVFTGQRGGLWAAMSPLIGTVLGAERAAITYVDDGRAHRLTVGGVIGMEIEDWIPPGGEEVAT